MFWASPSWSVCLGRLHPQTPADWPSQFPMRSYCSWQHSGTPAQPHPPHLIYGPRVALISSDRLDAVYHLSRTHHAPPPCPMPHVPCPTLWRAFRGKAWEDLPESALEQASLPGLDAPTVARETSARPHFNSDPTMSRLFLPVK